MNLRTFEENSTKVKGKQQQYTYSTYLGNIPESEQSQFGQVQVETIDPDSEDGQIWITGMIDKMRYIPILGCVNSVRALFITFIEVKVEEIGASFSIVLVPPPLRLFSSNHFPEVQGHKGTLPN